MYPNDVVKISLLPARTSCSMAPFGVRPFADVLEIGRLDLVAELLDERLASNFVLIGPAEIADRSEIDEANFQLVAADAAVRLVTPASRDGRAAKRVFLISFLHKDRRVNEQVQSAAPRRARSGNPLAIRHEHAASAAARSNRRFAPVISGPGR